MTDRLYYGDSYVIQFESTGGESSPVNPFFVGLTPNFVGPNQTNEAVPNDSPRASQVGAQLTTGLAVSNVVEIAVQ